MDEIGCTTPFGKNKSAICKESEESMKAMELYQKYFEHGAKYCLNPCTLSRMRASVLYQESNSDDRNTSLIYVNFEDEISHSQAFYTYSGLSLVAEIGGYVGLFLGISLNQSYKIIDYFRFVLSKFKVRH